MKFLLFISLFSMASIIFGAIEEEPTIHGKPEISVRTHRIANRFESDVKSGKFQIKTHHALDALIRLAAYKMRRDGYRVEAAQMIKEWETQYQFFLIDSHGIGDHKPLSQWLADKYDMIEFLIGKPTCDALHLSDIKVFNFGIPVCLWCEDHVDLVEYSNHFTKDLDHGYKGLAEVTVFWTSFIACVGGTWGTGFLFCSPIAMGAEYITENFIAPRLEQPCWKLACKQ